MSASLPDPGLRLVLEPGALLFDRGLFFEAHEVWEEAWKREAGDRRLLLQGLIQAAAAFVKWTRGEPLGAAKLIERGAAKLGSIRDPEAARLAGGLLTALEPWRTFLEQRAAGGTEASATPDFPKLDLRGE